MKKLSTLFVFSLLFITANSQSFQGATQIGITAQYSSTKSIHIDKKGNTYIAASVQGSTNILGKTVSATGNKLVYYVCKIKPDGKLAWLNKIITTLNYNYYIKGLRTDPSGSVYVVFNSAGALNFGNGNVLTINGIALVKYDSLGNFIYAKEIVNRTANYGYGNNSSLEIDDQYNIYLSGSYTSTSSADCLTFGKIKLSYTCGSNGNFLVKLDSACNAIWAVASTQLYNNSYYSINNIKIKGNKIYWMFSSFNWDIVINNKKYFKDDYTSSLKYLIVTLDTSGKTNSIFQFRTYQKYRPYMGFIEVKSNNNIYIALNATDSFISDSVKLKFKSSTKILLLAMDSNFKIKWLKTMEGPADGYVSGLELNKEGGYVIVGSYQFKANIDGVSLSTNGDYNAYVANFDSLGKLISFYQPNADDGSIDVQSAALNPAGNIVLVGDFSGKVIFGKTQLIDSIDFDGFITIGGQCNIPPEIKTASYNKLCYGDSIQLQVDTGYKSYTWYNNGVQQNIHSNKISAKESGFYRVVVDSGTCTGISNGITLNVGRPVRLGNDTLLCNTKSLVLDAGVYNTYSWSTGASTKSIVVTQNGTYGISVTDSLGCNSFDTITVKLNKVSNPAIQASGNTSVCSGDTVSLVLPAGYNTYQWYKDSNAINGERKTIYKAAEAGRYTTAVDSGGCVVMSFPVDVNIYPLPKIDLGKDIQSCISPVVVNAGSFAKYNWSTGDSARILNITKSGIYKCTVTNNFDCKNSDDINVLIDVPNKPLISRGHDTLFSTPAARYQWLYRGSVLPNDTNRFILPTSDGGYSVRTYNIINCLEQSDSFHFEFLTVPVPPESLDIRVYPNPVESELVLKFNLGAKVSANIAYELYNDVGQNIASGNVIVNTSQTQKAIFNMAGLSPGHYFIRVWVNDFFCVKKIVKL